jgi:dienelactone hydrolase
MADGTRGKVVGAGTVDGPGEPLPPSRRAFGAMLVGSAAFAMLPNSAGAAPNVGAVRVVDFDWVDEARRRPVPARLYWPAAGVRRGSVPLIVFSHGLGGSRFGYSYLGRHWSAHGVASLHVQHAASDREIWRGNLIELVDRLDVATQEEEAVARAEDLRFALDRMSDPTVGAFHTLIDRRRIVAAGHSYGANTTLVVTGAKVVREGRTVEHRDDRFKAGIVISAPPFYGETDLGAVLGAVNVPTLHVTATEDVIRLPGRYSPVQDRLDVYGAVGSQQKMLAVFQGGSHSVFTDRAYTGGVDLNPQVKRATAEAALAFLDLAFGGDARPISAWNAKWSPILALAPTPFPVRPADRARIRRFT